jgi:hypothetical protein
MRAISLYRQGERAMGCKILHLDYARLRVWNADCPITRHALKIALLTALALLMAIPAAAATDKIISFAPPGGIETQPSAINASGTVVGRYQDNNGDGIQSGFIRDASGNFTALMPRFRAPTKRQPFGSMMQVRSRAGTAMGKPPHTVSCETTSVTTPRSTLLDRVIRYLKPLIVRAKLAESIPLS